MFIFLKTPLPIFISDLKLRIYQMSMKRKLFNIDKKTPFSLLGLEKRAAVAIQNPVSYTHLTLPTNREV